MRDRTQITPSFRKVLRNRSREMRKEMSAAEAKLWAQLRGDHLDGLRFRRQHPVGPYIVDFFCPRKNLVIEVDGDSHFTAEQQLHDQERTVHFRSIGLRELRFTNDQVLTNIDGVVSAISRAMGIG